MTADRASRREFLHSCVAAGAMAQTLHAHQRRPALIAVTLDLEMSAQYPQRGMTEWNYQKGNLDQPTKDYATKAGKIVADAGGVLHYFCVGRVLEQPDVEWLTELSKKHPIGNHTYDHVHLKAKTPQGVQYRFHRAPWLVEGRAVPEVLRHNIRLTEIGLKQRCGIQQAGFRTPGGFSNGLSDRPDLQQMLLDLGFTWVSSQYPPCEVGEPNQTPVDSVFDNIRQAQSAAQPFTYPTGLIEVPMSPMSDVHAFRTLRWRRQDYLRAIRVAVEWAIETGGVFDFLAHPSCLLVEDPDLEAIHLICDRVQQAGRKAKIASLDELAQRAPSARASAR